MIMKHAYLAGTIISALGSNVQRGKESPDAVNDLLTLKTTTGLHKLLPS